MTVFWRLLCDIFAQPSNFMNYFRTLLLLFFCLKLSTGLSQILPPTLDCIRGDTLYWTPENNNCGPFVSTDVFFSPNPAGPYSLLASISDPGATSFHHPAMGDAYYFLQSNYNCPGQTPIPSDTINNLPPLSPPWKKYRYNLMVFWCPGTTTWIKKLSLTLYTGPPIRVLFPLTRYLGD